MKISIEHLRIIFKKYGSEAEMKYFDGINLRTRKFLAGDILLEEHLDVIEQNRFYEIEILFNDILYEYLNHALPAVYRKPYTKKPFIEVDRLLENLQQVNTLSGRQRYITIVGDIYGFDSKEGRKVILFSHGEPVDFKKWNSVKRDMDKNKIISFRNGEVPIIVFVNLVRENKSGYVESFRKNTDLISILVSQRPDHQFLPSNDFIPTEDVISVTSPEELLDIYKTSNARLIIIGENIDGDYKTALMNVRSYDKFVRMMVVPGIDHRNRDHFHKQVQLVYNSDRW